MIIIVLKSGQKTKKKSNKIHTYNSNVQCDV